MKKGCFLTVIITLTIIVLGIFYLVKFHGEDLLEMGKEQLVEIAQDRIFSNLDELGNSQYSDSLKIVVNNYFKDINSLDIEDELKRIEEFSDDIEVILLDSKIDSAEFDFITNILTKYERRKEN
jgi:uncharacterized membrane protein